MKEVLSFDSPISLAVVLACSVAVFLFLVWLEWRNQLAYLPARIVCSFLLVLSLVGVITRPTYFGTSIEKPILLLTKGYQPATVDSLLRVHDLDIFQNYDSLKYEGATQISAHELPVIENRIKFIVGNGLSTAFLRQRKNILFTYIPASIPSGIADLNIPPLVAGNPAQVKGRLSHTADSVKIILSSPGGSEDSVLVTKADKDFSLAFTPAQAGRFEYSITIRDDKNTLRETLPLVVAPKRTLRLLLLQKYPTFETKYLKNYLIDRGHALTTRYLVSRNTYRHEYANVQQQVPVQVNAEALSNFDLVLLSGEAADALTAHEAAQLDKAITNGLGLIFTDPPARAFRQKLRPIFPFDCREGSTDSLALAHFAWQNEIKLPPAPVTVARTPALHPVWQDQQGNVASGYVLKEQGKIGFHFLPNVFSFSLEGRLDLFSVLWTPILERVARSEQAAFMISMDSPDPFFVNQYLPVKVLSTSVQPDLYLNNTWVPLREDEWVDDLWHTTILVKEPGWHKLKTQDSTALNFYAHQPGAWPARNAHLQIAENKKHHSSKIDVQPIEVENERAIPPVWFFVLFLIASTFLWLSPKL